MWCIKVGYKLVVDTTCKSTYVACSRWLMGKYPQIMKGWIRKKRIKKREYEVVDEPNNIRNH
jgi:hypothetical protein